MSLRPTKKGRGPKIKETPSKYGVHIRKFSGRLFHSYGAGGFFTGKAAADRMAKKEREWGSEARVVKVVGGYRLFLRDKPKKKK